MKQQAFSCPYESVLSLTIVRPNGVVCQVSCPFLPLRVGEESTSHLCLAILKKFLLLQFTSSPSGHQGEILRFIRAHHWHAKFLAGKVVWIAKNEFCCSQLWRVIPL